jgi:thiamine-phosphate pyrophosphorylase
VGWARGVKARGCCIGKDGQGSALDPLGAAPPDPHPVLARDSGRGPSLQWMRAWGRCPQWGLGGKAPYLPSQCNSQGMLPPLWLFTDRARLGDPALAIRRLPVGLAGVVLRGADAAEARRIAALCRRRRLALSIAAEGAGVGLHLRAGRRVAGPRPAFVTSSAHDAAELRRALRAGADVIFLSPVFATASHPGAPGLGIYRWAALAQRCPAKIGALGGISARRLACLPRWCRYAGAIGALSERRGAPRPKVAGGGAP